MVGLGKCRKLTKRGEGTPQPHQTSRQGSLAQSIRANSAPSTHTVARKALCSSTNLSCHKRSLQQYSIRLIASISQSYHLGYSHLYSTPSNNPSSTICRYSSHLQGTFAYHMRRAMPPRSSLTSSFSTSEATHEVVCPLTVQDGSKCRKRCLGVCSLGNNSYLLIHSNHAEVCDGDGQLNCRRSAIGRCKSIFAEHTRRNISRSSLRLRKASS